MCHVHLLRRIACVDSQVLWRENSAEPWQMIEQEKVDILHETGNFFVRARINHFSEGCLATSVDMQCSYYEEVVRWRQWGRPRRREFQVLNATDRAIIILALPTGFSNKIVGTFTVGVNSSMIGMNTNIRRAVDQAMLSEGASPQMFQLAVRDGPEPPRAGDKCPYEYCSLSEWTGNEAKVALITASDSTMEVWDYRIIKGGTRIAVLPKRFSPGMRPLLGNFRRCDLPEGLTDIEVALTAVGRVVLIREGINLVASRVSTASLP